MESHRVSTPMRIFHNRIGQAKQLSDHFEV